MHPPIRDHSNFLDLEESPSVECCDDHLTEQHHAQDCDINVIMRRFALGMLPTTAFAVEYGVRDTREQPAEALQARAKLNEWYRSLPPSVRQTHPTVDHVLDSIAQGRLLFKGPDVPAAGAGASGPSASASAPAGGQGAPTPPAS